MKGNSENHDNLSFRREEDELAEKLEAWSERYSVFDIDEVENGNTMEFDLSDAEKKEASEEKVTEDFSEVFETEDETYEEYESFTYSEPEEPVTGTAVKEEDSHESPEDMEKTRSFTFQHGEPFEDAGKTRQFTPVKEVREEFTGSSAKEDDDSYDYVYEEDIEDEYEDYFDEEYEEEYDETEEGGLRTGFFRRLKERIKADVEEDAEGYEYEEPSEIGWESDDEYDELEFSDVSEEEPEDEPAKRRFFGIGKRRTAKHQTIEIDSVPEKDRGRNPEAEIFKGLDSNPTSPKMVMELADRSGSKRSRTEKQALAQKTVGIRPIFNENIEHHILSNPVERSAQEKAEIKGATGEIPGQTRMAQVFIRPDMMDPDEKENNSRDMEKTRNIREKADLEPVPTVIAADADLTTFDKAIVAHGGSRTVKYEPGEALEGQLCLFNMEHDEPPQIDEEGAEEELRERRKKRISEFTLDTDAVPEDMDEPVPQEEEYYSSSECNELLRELSGENDRLMHNTYISDYMDDEYVTPEDKERIGEKLGKGKLKTLVTSIAQLLVTAGAVFVTWLISAGGGNLEAVGGSVKSSIIINIALLLIASALGFATLKKGVHGLLNGRFNVSSAATLAVIICIIEDVALLVLSGSGATEVGLYTGSVCFLLSMISVSRYVAFKRASRNFDFITGGTQLYSTECVESPEDASLISRGLLIENPVVGYNAKIKNPSGFVESSFADDPADYNMEKPGLIVLIVSLVAGIAYGIFRQNIAEGLALFTAVYCIGIPAFALMPANLSLLMAAKVFTGKGAAILGHRAVESSAYINTFAIDNTDIIRDGYCQISPTGIKLFHGMKIDDALIYAAAPAIAAGGPLADVFDRIILSRHDILPEVEDVVYEERLGISAWLGKRRILFGNRNLLINHNIEVLSPEEEARYAEGGKKIVYLAIHGKLAAMFAFVYLPDPHMSRCLQNIDRAGITLLIQNRDCNITEEMICKFYNLPPSAVKILSPVSGDTFHKYRRMERNCPSIGILHNSTIESSMKSLYEARSLYDGVSVSGFILKTYMIIAMILSAVLVFTGGVGIFTDMKIFIFQLIWTVVITVVTALHGRKIKQEK